MRWLGVRVPSPALPFRRLCGGVPEWPKGTDCKSVGDAFGGSNPPPSTLTPKSLAAPRTTPYYGRTRGSSGSSSAGRALAFQAGCRGFESRLPLQFSSNPRGPRRIESNPPPSRVRSGSGPKNRLWHDFQLTGLNRHNTFRCSHLTPNDF